jgi:hypothetical protein
MYANHVPMADGLVGGEGLYFLEESALLFGGQHVQEQLCQLKRWLVHAGDLYALK